MGQQELTGKMSTPYMEQWELQKTGPHAMGQQESTRSTAPKL